MTLAPPIVNERQPGSVSESRASFWSGWWPTSGAVGEIAPLDGLRGIAVLLVLMVHSTYETGHQTQDALVKRVLEVAGPFTGFGGTGVHLFFVLSGFLLFLPFARAAMGVGKFPKVGRFYWRRALRILPAYWASMILFVLLVDHRYLERAEWPNLGLHVVMLHNFDSTMLGSIIGPYWTLAVEWQFYMVLPLLGMLIVPLVRGRRFGVLGGAAVGAMLLGIFIGLVSIFVRRHVSFMAPHLTLLGMFSFFPVFTAGIAASFVYVSVTETTDSRRGARIRTWCKVAGVSGVSVLLAHTLLRAAHVQLDRFDYFLFSVMSGLSYAGILLGVVTGWRTWARVFSWPGLRFVGGISFSVYLWHYPIYERFITPLAVGHASGLWQILLVQLGTLVVVMPFGLLSYWVLEKPFIKARHRKALA